MENPMVKCSISNCEYWESGNNCSAEVIMIEVNAHADKPGTQSKDGLEYDSRHQDQASGVIDTCCQTFEERTSH
ncbi:DUF1540 domain-containing protein [Paenibacillus mucilaginosus]|uniref:DUF1540 domain-containing protein n=3 Tax=Paenibacillus mucilaginosus TaxID=61624 RepID=H6NBM1_9BACL|nr:DUF1540 domain-containing protein [Paenibacillus mucilaginosus]AEI46172.1 hypothetical protein KNP414_07686 [Paenibacillus mucilaginosus KNP414]AFC33790.1 hypothetical protein PM3016_7214 [Paenibacillus mucilaginosus 3016]AFH66120.1 hypothetical protein B2K_36395 [Paenibacillus mucilaginosus K02]MCG7213696.1 DUF1540 domain-containing protein [Paenibacillus mucilaginosus]WDM27500.1 DUF1540 domain-containing protein [Paenibacillus mucilaginosus]